VGHASLVEIFCGSDDVVSLRGVTVDDDTQADKLMQLMKYQLTIKNNWLMFMYGWMKNALKNNIGIAKVTWERKFKSDDVQKVMAYDAVEYLRHMDQTQPNKIDIVSIEPIVPTTDLFNVHFKLKTMQTNYPKVEVVLASELRYNPDAKSLETATFVEHVKVVTADYLKRKEKDGVYSDVDTALKSAANPQTTQLEDKMNDYRTKQQYESTDARRQVELHECYTQHDINGDGLLEDVIVWRVGSTVIRIEENTFGRFHPFFAISPLKDPHRVMAKRGYADLIAQLQHIKTAMLRQMIISISQANEPRVVINEDAINMNDFISGRNYIRSKQGASIQDIRNAVFPITSSQLSSATIPFLQYIEDQKAERTGVTPYTQGQDSDSMNKTATGINILTQSANQRLRLIARIFLETGVKELFRFLIELNQRFIDEPQVIRLTGEPMEIRPDDLRGEFDLQVNAAISTGTKQQNIQYIQLILSTLVQAMQMGLKVVTEENIYNLLKKLVNELGYKNTDEFLTNPAIIMQMQQAAQAAQLQAAAQLQQQQLGGAQVGQPGQSGQPGVPGVPGQAQAVTPANEGWQGSGNSAEVPGGIPYGSPGAVV